MPADKPEIVRRRRTKLASLKSNVPVGPLIDGLRESDEILVASFYNRRTCQRFRNALSTAEISSETKSNRVKISVYVNNVDRARAFELLDEHRQAHPDKRPTGIRRDYDATILCTLVGIAGAIAFLAASQDDLVRVVSSMGWIVSSLCVGLLADRCRRNYYYFGQLQFSVAEFLAFTTVVASLIAFWAFVSRLYV